MYQQKMSNEKVKRHEMVRNGDVEMKEGIVIDENI